MLFVVESPINARSEGKVEKTAIRFGPMIVWAETSLILGSSKEEVYRGSVLAKASDGTNVHNSGYHGTLKEKEAIDGRALKVASRT